MTHDTALQHLHAAADGRLSLRERAALEAHLAACAECRAVAAELESLQLALSHSLRARWDALPIPAGLPRKVLNRVRPSDVRPPILRVAGALAGVGALVALILFFGALFGGTSPGAGPGTLPTEVFPPAPASVGGAEGLIAFESTRDGNPEIYLMRADGSGQTNLTNNPAADIAPAWSPDGARIAFISDRTGRQEIYVMPAPVAQAQVNVEDALQGADGSGVTQLTDDPGALWWGAPLAWSPDGTRLVAVRAYMFSETRTQAQIYLINADGTGSVPLIPDQRTAFNNYNPKWSPEGERIAFISGRYTTAGLFTIFSDGTDQKSLALSAVESIHALAWSPDGTRLAYVFTRSHYNGRQYESQASIKFIYPDGAVQTLALLPKDLDPFIYAALSWSPDGTRLILASGHKGNAADSQQIYILWADGSGLTRITDGPANHNQPRWAPDGEWIAFVEDRGAAKDIYVMNVENAIRSPGTLTPIRLTTTGKDHDPQWQPVAAPSAEQAAQSSPGPKPTFAPAIRVLGVHRVQSRETIRCIASAYGVAASAIVRLNRLGDPPQLHSGPVLIPDVKGEDYEAGPACSPQFPSPYSLDPVVTVPAPATFPFALTDEGISARPNFANAAGCDWLGMGGQAFARSGEPLAGLVVHLEGGGVVWDTLTGSKPEYGPGGYEIQIADFLATTTGVYRAQLRDPRGQPLSEWIAVDTFADCSKNLLMVNFAQR
jgi:Tol biopolymer transport system component